MKLAILSAILGEPTELKKKQIAVWDSLGLQDSITFGDYPEVTSGA